LKNVRGERFMPRYHQAAELAPRDIVARAILREMKQTGSDRVYLDLGALSSDQIRSRFPNIYETCLQYGLDITAKKIPVAPAAHYMMGGIFTDLDGRTTIPGLYACGETADPGVHGANRLASNSLLEGLVFGRRIVDYLGRRRTNIEPRPPDADLVEKLPSETDPNDAERDRQALRECMSARMGIVREENGLEETLRFLKEGEHPPPSPCLDPGYLELQNLRTVAALMTRAALIRRESRGSHYRRDYPETDPGWRKRILLQGNRADFLEIGDALPSSLRGAPQTNG